MVMNSPVGIVQLLGTDKNGSVVALVLRLV